jgi:hypothetical protein
LLEKTEGAIKNGQSRDTGNIVHNTKNEDNQNKKHAGNYKNEQHALTTQWSKEKVQKDKQRSTKQTLKIE